MKNTYIGRQMYAWAKDLFPINRSLTGDGVRETLQYIKNVLPDLKIESVPTGFEVFDWKVPKEWNVKEAYIENPNGERVIDFKKNNLHLVGYSTPINKKINLDDLQAHLYSLPKQPDAIPYVTSYYSESWGFCLTENQRKGLEPGEYRVVIDSELKNGELNYGEIIIPGETEQEIFLSTYICHPSMGNNELSGPVVTMALAEWLNSLNFRKNTFRIVFVPETIGSIVYISQNLQTLREKVHAGFNVTCVGDNNCYSYVPSRKGNTVSDTAAKHVLKYLVPEYIEYSWLDRGSDERQYCAPGVDLPIATICRSKYSEYPEYHTSLDNLEFISPEGLYGGYSAIKRAIETIEQNKYYNSTLLCEPQLGKRGLYRNTSIKGSGEEARLILNLISYCDGDHSLLEIAEKLQKPLWELNPIVENLLENKLIRNSRKDPEAYMAVVPPLNELEDKNKKFKLEISMPTANKFEGVLNNRFINKIQS